MSFDVCMDMLPPLIKEHLEAVGDFNTNKPLPIYGGDAASLARRGDFPLADVLPRHLLPQDGATPPPLCI